jgi:geranylgeranyl diphosphate synthase type II
MWELLLTNQKRISADSAFEILKEFSVMLNETTEGQQIELSWSISGSWNIGEQEYFTMVTKKSAWYTCIAPARLGTILAWKANHNSDEKQQVLRLIIEVGTAMGIAFQIVDDVLNLTASEAKYGKEILGDLFEGKRTLMMIHLLSKCQEREKNQVLSIMQKTRSEKTLEDMDYVFNLMKQFGSIDYASQVARAQARRGLSLYDKLCTEHGLDSSAAYETTRLLLEYLVKRDY